MDIKLQHAEDLIRFFDDLTLIFKVTAEPITVNSEILARVLVSRNFAYVNFHEN